MASKVGAAPKSTLAAWLRNELSKAPGAASV
jgi:hypothetical protein